MGAIAVCGSPVNARRGAVLVVEDEILIRLSLAEVLRDEGFSVLEAANADEAVAVLASSATIDVVMTDVNMPGSLDGLALGRFVRTTRPGLKVIVVSGRVTPAAATEAADAFLAKPYDAERVVNTIHRLLSDASR
jgi:DNA-binding NtrC family response regulator